MNWDQIVEKITPCVVKIETPSGHGTGFLCFYNEDRSVCGIATASHVVSHADRWLQPMRLHHHPSQKVALLNESERIILTDITKDSAVVVTPARKLKLPEEVIPLLPTNARLPIGVEVGWIGYPAIGPQNTLCFFSGSISARLDSRNAYLIDGVAING